MVVFGGLVIAVLCAALCYMIASGKDRDPTWFVVGGFFLTILGVIIALAAWPADKIERSRAWERANGYR